MEERQVHRYARGETANQPIAKGKTPTRILIQPRGRNMGKGNRQQKRQALGYGASAAATASDKTIIQPREENRGMSGTS